MYRLVGAMVLLILAGCSVEPEGLPVGTLHSALGVPQDGFPTWQERMILVLTNRARSDPGAEVDAVCTTTSCQKYSASKPVQYSFNRGRAARFQSASLFKSKSKLMHESVCTLVANLGDIYPSSCDGSPSCACEGGVADCSCSISGYSCQCTTGSPYCTAPGGLTKWSDRVKRFGTTANGENIAANSGGDAISTFNQWVKSSGHWSNINKSTHGWLGTGHFGQSTGGGCYKHFWAQVFASGTVTQTLTGGAHYPQSGTTSTQFKFWANYYDSGAPQLATVNVDGTCYSMTLERGADDNGAFLKEMSLASTGCLRYYFYFRDASGTVVTYPDTGSFGVGVGTTTCSNYDANARPALGQGCGGCTADAECADTNVCTQDTCVSNKCQNTAISGCCTTAAQCGDGDPCTQDSCVSNKCQNTAISGCCTADSQCSDGNVCTQDKCTNNTCGNPAIAGCCTASSQCDDSDPCTQDSCAANTCQHAPTSGCCKADAECDDNGPCTKDTCVANKCQHSPLSGCCATDADCADNNPCTQEICQLPAGNCSVTQTPDCCSVDVDCDDGDPCTVDGCDANNKCEFVQQPGCGDPKPDAGSGPAPGQEAGPSPTPGSDAGVDDPPPQRRVPQGSDQLVGGCSVGGGSAAGMGMMLVVFFGLALIRRRG